MKKASQKLDHAQYYLYVSFKGSREGRQPLSNTTHYSSEIKAFLHTHVGSPNYKCSSQIFHLK